MLFVSCDKDEKTTEEAITEDEMVPELTVMGFTDVIEVNSTISVSISDDSTVDTKVLIGTEELASSSEKQFEFLLNPYNIPVGITDFIVTSTDVKGNEISETYSVEIKHLLMSYEVNTEDLEGFEHRWLFFNNLNGKELAAIELSVGIHKVYTEDDKSENKVLTSLANYYSFQDGPQFFNINTNEIWLGNSRKPLAVIDNSDDQTSTVDVLMNGVSFENSSPSYDAYGANYRTTKYSGDDLNSTITIEHNATTPIYITPYLWSEPIFDGRKENYSYLRIVPEEGITSVEVEADDFVAADAYVKLDVPTHDMGTLYFSRRGFENEEGLADYQQHYVVGSTDASDENIEYVDLPIVSGLSIYDNNLSYFLNDNYFIQEA